MLEDNKHIFVNVFIPSKWAIELIWAGIFLEQGSTTPITAIGCRQCLPLSVVQLKGKHSWKPQCRNGIVDTFGHDLLYENIKVCEELIVLFKYIYNQIAIKAEAFC